MIVLQALLFILLIIVPGALAVRIVKKQSLAYAVGLGMLFNVIVGVVANFTLGLVFMPLILIYICSLIISGLISWKCGHTYWKFKWSWSICIVFIVALGLQYQTSLISPNLIGSDIHLEYYQANQIVVNGYWNPLERGSAMNACLGLVIFLPVIKLLTGMSMLMVFKVLCPLLFAIVPIIIFKIYKDLFGALIAWLAVIFFVTMPMFTMDMVQLIRQQQSEIYFILTVLVFMDKGVNVRNKIILAAIFSIGAIVMHYGLSLGLMGYLLIGSALLVVLNWFWKNQLFPMKTVVAMVSVAFIMLFVYVGYYSYVNKGDILVVGIIPLAVLGDTTKQVVVGYQQPVTTENSNRVGRTDVIIEHPKTSKETVEIVTFNLPEPIQIILDRFHFLSPFIREPILQTAIGLDFGRASLLGKVWRILQYLVEICLLVGIVRFIIRPSNGKVFWVFVTTSFFVIAGLYLLSTYSYGMGATRVWQVTLLFMSPMFVLGAYTIFSFMRLRRNLVIAFSSLIILVPYALFNLGVVFEVAKMQPVGFIDVPYSVALSGHRVDIASVFDKEDVAMVEWFKEYMSDNEIMYGDTHVARLLAQRFGWILKQGDMGELYVIGNIRTLEYLDDFDEGYVFLSKRNVETNLVTCQAEYASRISYNIDDSVVLKDKLANGETIFDNGARIVKVK